ncbi:MAG: hypothetical protein P0S96_03545 [Simkaniaceae bacterium]|nr:hypothetical protein [Candidatus Sacchlamyda saccharinae]
MTRISKQAERRAKCPRKCKPPQPKTGAKKDNLPKGFKEHSNALEGDIAKTFFVPKIS